MDTALIIIIAAVVLLAILFLAPRIWNRGQEARREKARELRAEADQRKERAERAQAVAESEREEAAGRATRADRIDPDTKGGPGVLGRSRRKRDEEYQERDEEYQERGDREEPAEGRRGRRPSLWERATRR
jgi:hypothetical protein